MTKQDLRAITRGAVVGGGIAWLLWYLFQQKATIREINPALVKWEGL